MQPGSLLRVPSKLPTCSTAIAAFSIRGSWIRPFLSPVALILAAAAATILACKPGGARGEEIAPSRAHAAKPPSPPPTLRPRSPRASSPRYSPEQPLRNRSKRSAGRRKRRFVVPPSGAPRSPAALRSPYPRGILPSAKFQGIQGKRSRGSIRSSPRVALANNRP